MVGSRDTIFALSSGALPAGVAVLRVSGPGALAACQILAGDMPVARKAALKSIRRRNGEILDEGLVIVFPGPNSFTGEDCVEFHLHGSRAVVAAVYQELQGLGCRLAEAGEFSRRAFEHGKLDLVEVEGLADLLVAETEMQRRLAIEESFGTQSKLYASWRQRVLHARAMLEAELDFADEEDVTGGVSQTVLQDIRHLHGEMEKHLELDGAGEIIRDGFKVVIAGPPNAGKSSLMNALAGSEIAIVSDIAGTTRDVLHVDLNLGGYLVRLFDTAGLREASDEVERIGIARARLKLQEADLIILLNEINKINGIKADFSGTVPTLRVATKADLGEREVGSEIDLLISTHSGAGLTELRAAILHHVESRTMGLLRAVPSRIRHSGHIREAISNLQSAEKWSNAQTEMAAESLRLASDSLGRISGRIDTEEILGVIFSSFCIGK